MRQRAMGGGVGMKKHAGDALLLRGLRGGRLLLPVCVVELRRGQQGLDVREARCHGLEQGQHHH